MAIGRRHFGGAKAAQAHGAARLHQTPVSGCRHRKELPLKKDHPWAGIPPRPYWLPACCCPAVTASSRQHRHRPAAQQNSAVTGLVRQQLTALLADRPDHLSHHHRDRHRPTGGAPPNGAVTVPCTSGGCQAQYGFLYRQNGSSYRTIGQGPGIGATSPPAAGKHPTQ